MKSKGKLILIEGMVSIYSNLFISVLDDKDENYVPQGNKINKKVKSGLFERLLFKGKEAANKVSSEKEHEVEKDKNKEGGRKSRKVVLKYSDLDGTSWKYSWSGRTNTEAKEMVARIFKQVVDAQGGN
jgi:hypothetical protein